MPSSPFGPGRGPRRHRGPLRQRPSGAGLPVAADLPDRPLELVVAPEEMTRQFASHGETGRQCDGAGYPEADGGAGETAEQAGRQRDD